MSLRLGDEAPDFTADSTDGEIRFHDYLGDSWGVLFSHPKDFTPVCTTELGRVAALKGEFDARGVKVLGLSVDPVSDHRAWAGDIEETQGHALNFPLLADPERKVAELYDMIHPNELDTLTVRSVFVIGPDKRVKLTITYPASTGRNFDELLRPLQTQRLLGQRVRHSRSGIPVAPDQLDGIGSVAHPGGSTPGNSVHRRILTRRLGERGTISPDSSLRPGHRP